MCSSAGTQDRVQNTGQWAHRGEPPLPGICLSRKRRPGEGSAPTCQAEGAEDELGAVEDGEATVSLVAGDRGLGSLEVLGVLPRTDFLYLHDVH